MPDLANLLNEDHWIEFTLVDNEERPIPLQRYELTDPAGRVHFGSLDENGYARLEAVKAGACTVYFPQLGYRMSVEACQP